MELFSTTKSAGARDATSPGWGALRSLLGVALAAWVTSFVIRQGGSAEMGDAAGQAAVETAGSFLPIILGGVVGTGTYIRKRIQNRLAN